MSTETSRSTAVPVARPLRGSAADALRAAVDRAMLAPSLHNSQPGGSPSTPTA